MRLDIGAGPRSTAEVQVDIFKWEKTTHVFDAMVEDWCFENDMFDEVRMEQILEHAPPSLRWKEDGKWNKMYPRIHMMKEAYRVLKPGGILHCSVPAEIEEWAQDPTHEGPIILEGFFDYFCGASGGGTPGEFAYDTYGITFKFKKVQSFRSGFILTVRLQK